MIDYSLIDNSIKHYSNKGFIRIETPWAVSEEVSNITKPSDKISYEIKHNNKCLVASGEQSFLYLYLKEFLPLGQYQTVTPCFRSESFDFLHSKYFIKNELIKTDIVNEDEMVKIVHIAFDLFSQYFDKKKLYIEDTADGMDIMIDGKELGSYGIRSCNFLKWIYGTGLAEPRTSKLIKLYGR